MVSLTPVTLITMAQKVISATVRRQNGRTEITIPRIITGAIRAAGIREEPDETGRNAVLQDRRTVQAAEPRHLMITDRIPIRKHPLRQRVQVQLTANG